MSLKLKMENLTKVFGSLMAVKNLNLEILDGEFVCFVGPSGCGKTTTLNMLSGLEQPTSGNIILDGEIINKLPARKRDIGLIFQDYAIFENMNVYDNLAFSLQVKKTLKGEIEQIVRDVAKRLYLTDMLTYKTSQLTPGELQRVAIGRTVIMGPSIFLLDEPLDNLDADMRITMRGELKRLQKNLGKTMVYVTHDQEEAMSMADRVVVMNGGELQQFDSPQNIYKQPKNKFVASFIGKIPMNFIDGDVNEKNGGLCFIDKSFSLKINLSCYRENIKKSTAGVELCLGIRPEHISLVSPSEDDSFEVEVGNIQFLGMENIIEFSLKNDLKKSHKIMLPPEIIPRIGDKLWVKFQIDRIYLIDPITEKVLV